MDHIKKYGAESAITEYKLTYNTLKNWIAKNKKNETLID